MPPSFISSATSWVCVMNLTEGWFHPQRLLAHRHRNAFVGSTQACNNEVITTMEEQAPQQTEDVQQPAAEPQQGAAPIPQVADSSASPRPPHWLALLLHRKLRMHD